jgi:electron transfer flavoprotein alpha subunit
MGEVLVYVELVDAQVSPGSQRLLAFARQLADSCNSSLTALIASAERVEPGALGPADVCAEVRHPALWPYVPEAHEAALGAAVRARAPDIVLVENTTVGLDLAGAVAMASDMPFVSYCVELSVRSEDAHSKSEIYGGLLLAEVHTRLPAVFAMNSGALPDEPTAHPGRGEWAAIAPPAQLDSLRMTFVEPIEAADPGIDITKADRLVCVGRGVGSAKDMAVAEELAAALRAELAASRPVVDAGWAPRARQVGKSGSRVKPRLYLALGVSGAPEHVEGMRASELIVAVNTDPNAPIFNVAHFGAVADLFDVAEELSKLVGD